MSLSQQKSPVDWSSLRIGELVGTELEWSTIAAETRSARQNIKPELFVLRPKSYTGGLVHIREHLDGSIKPRHVSSPPIVCH